MVNLSGVRTGPLEVGERVTLIDPKGRRKSVVLREGAVWHTTKGAVSHDELIGGPEGVTVRSVGGTEYLVLRPLMSEYMVGMPREAAVIYPKDAAQIIMWADIFPGARSWRPASDPEPFHWRCYASSVPKVGCTPTNAGSSSLTSPAGTSRISSAGNIPPGFWRWVTWPR